MPERQPLSGPVTVDALVSVICLLLEDARQADEVDHNACVKYVDCLVKLLPLQQKEESARPGVAALREKHAAKVASMVSDALGKEVDRDKV